MHKLSVCVSAVFLVLNCKPLGPREALSVLLEIKKIMLIGIKVIVCVSLSLAIRARTLLSSCAFKCQAFQKVRYAWA